MALVAVTVLDLTEETISATMGDLTGEGPGVAWRSSQRSALRCVVLGTVAYSSKEESQWHLAVISYLRHSSQSLSLSVAAAPLGPRNRVRPWRARQPALPRA